MASLEVSALARAAAAWLPVGVTGRAPRHHPAGHGAWPGLTGAVPGPAERHPGLLRRRPRRPAVSCPPGSPLPRARSIPASQAGDPLPHRRRKDGM